MTPEQKLKHLILLKQQEWEPEFLKDAEITADNVDEIYEENDEGGRIQDARYVL